MTDSKTRLVGIIQCDFAKDRCSGFGCVNSFTQRGDAFEVYPEDPGVMVVPFNCGGCPGRQISRTAANLVERAEKKAGIAKEEITIHLSTCMVTDNGHYPPCPHLDYIEEILRRKGLRTRRGSYKSKTAEKRRGDGRYKGFDWESCNPEEPQSS